MPLDITFKPELIQQLIDQSENGTKEVHMYFAPTDSPDEQDPDAETEADEPMPDDEDMETQIMRAKTQQTASQRADYPMRRK